MLTCPKCSAAIAPEVIGSNDLSPCPACGTMLMARAFPALLRDPRAGENSAEKVVSGEEASCFYHPAKKAEVACDACGRFLCALCDVELEGQHLCPSCLSVGRKKGKLRNLENERVLYDNIALALAVLPVLMWPFTLVTAPASIYIVIRHWNSPTSILPRTKLRFMTAFVLALAQVVGWCVLAYYVFSRFVQ